MSEGLILADGETVVYANPAARSLFGVEEMELLPPQIPRPVDAAPTSATFSIRHPIEREIRCSATTIDGGQTLVVAQDVTESQRIDRIRADFVANASHEMKTPVAAILATAETLQGAVTDDPAAATRFSATLAKEARRLSVLITDLLDLARLDRPPTAQGPVSLSGLGVDAVALLAPLADAKGLEMTAPIEVGLMVRGRAEDLSAMLRNLIENAIRYTPTGGRVEVTVRADAGRARIEVTDSGVGIPAKELARIFERFYRVDPARSRDTGGTGLGLSIVRHVAEAHGGSVRADSTLGVGSTFTVTLPLEGRA